MTEPTTEAGRDLAKRYSGDREAFTNVILAIEAEARAAGYKAGIDGAVTQLAGVRADALREAAERVRALRDDKRYVWWHEDTAWLYEDAVLAILEPKP